MSDEQYRVERIVDCPDEDALETALELAQPGDVIRLTAGRTYRIRSVRLPDVGNGPLPIRSSTG